MTASQARGRLMFGASSMASPATQGGLWDVLRKEARRSRCSAARLALTCAPTQARKLESEVDSKLAAFSKLGALRLHGVALASG